MFQILYPQDLHQFQLYHQLMDKHNDFNAIIDAMIFEPDVPQFYLLNIGETHYPYTLPGEGNDLPIIHGMHGIFKHMDDFVAGNSAPAQAADHGGDKFFHMDKMLSLKAKQQSNIEYLDGLFDIVKQKDKSIYFSKV